MTATTITNESVLKISRQSTSLIPAYLIEIDVIVLS